MAHVNPRVAYPGGGEAFLRGPEGRIWPNDFWKKSPLQLGGRSNVQSTPSAASRGGEAWRRTCEDPRMLGRVLDSAFIQARVRLSCSNSLIYKGHGLHTFRRDFFQKSSSQILPSCPLRESSPPPGYATCYFFLINQRVRKMRRDLQLPWDLLQNSSLLQCR